MDTNNFLTINNQPLCLGTAIGYLQFSGKLEEFFYEILKQHVIRQEVELQANLKIDEDEIQGSINNFCLEMQFNNKKQFHDWLKANEIEEATFRQQIELGLKIAYIKKKKIGTKLYDHFINHKLFLDRVVLSRIVVDNQDLAEEILAQIKESERGDSFEAFARDYSLTDDRIFNGMMGLISRAIIPDNLRAIIDPAKVGDVIGPIWVEQNWCIYRIEGFYPASLENKALRESLEDEIWEQWLSEQVKNLEAQIKIQFEQSKLEIKT